MDTWTIVNGVLYLVSFVMIGYMLLDATRVSRK